MRTDSDLLRTASKRMTVLVTSASAWASPGEIPVAASGTPHPPAGEGCAGDTHPIVPFQVVVGVFVGPELARRADPLPQAVAANTRRNSAVTLNDRQAACATEGLVGTD